MIFSEKPKNFNPRYHTVCVFMFNLKGEALFLKRASNKSEGGKFGIPGGKREKDETSLNTGVREVKEETGIDIDENDLKSFKTVYVKYPEHDFIFEMFETEFFTEGNVLINPEHSEFKWVTLDQALKNLPLVRDMDECIKLFKKAKPQA